MTFTDIGFNHQVKARDEALQRVVTVLTEAGHTQAAYLWDMRKREGQISTYLGNDIAIPHGASHSHDAAPKTGAKVLAYPQGVDWGKKQIAYLIVSITARGNEHLDILRQFTHALSDDRVPNALTRASIPQTVLEILTGDIPLPASGEPQPAPHFDEEATFTLRNPRGLHARPSAVLVKAIKQWRSRVQVENLDACSATIGARNLMRVVSLGAKQGHRLHFITSGNDAQRALKAIGDASSAGLDEIAAQP